MEKQKQDSWQRFFELWHAYVKELNHKKMSSQIKILKMVLFKHKNQLRKDKSYQYLQKVFHTCLKFLDFKTMWKYIEELPQLLMDAKREGSFTSESKDIRYCAAEDTTLNSCCLSLHDASLILLKAMEMCKSCFFFVLLQLKIGLFLTFNIFAASMVAYLWFQCRKFLFINIRLMQEIHNVSSVVEGANVQDQALKLKNIMNMVQDDADLCALLNMFRGNKMPNRNMQNSRASSQLMSSNAFSFLDELEDIGVPVNVTDIPKLSHTEKITSVPAATAHQPQNIKRRRSHHTCFDWCHLKWHFIPKSYSLSGWRFIFANKKRRIWLLRKQSKPCYRQYLRRILIRKGKIRDSRKTLRRTISTRGTDSPIVHRKNPVFIEHKPVNTERRCLIPPTEFSITPVSQWNRMDTQQSTPYADFISKKRSKLLVFDQTPTLTIDGMKPESHLDEIDVIFGSLG